MDRTYQPVEMETIVFHEEDVIVTSQWEAEED